ncbi:hypothetical protein HAX54_050754 [Datura stramonium]|uniref:Uncharacterized protein n=1 Tax=Datura stramonium TaxID=4076 RepID=A0ABS8SWV3_DATST|nr:hypothetical protein [Datura stramonium]
MTVLGQKHVLPRFMGNIDDCISSCHHSTSSATMTDEQLNFLLVNLHNLSKYLAEQKFPFVTQYGILRNVCGSIRDFHGLIEMNGFALSTRFIECVLPQFQLMAERVGLFIWDDQTVKALSSAS